MTFIDRLIPRKLLKCAINIAKHTKFNCKIRFGIVLDFCFFLCVCRDFLQKFQVWGNYSKNPKVNNFRNHIVGNFEVGDFNFYQNWKHCVSVKFFCKNSKFGKILKSPKLCKPQCFKL